MPLVPIEIPSLILNFRYSEGVPDADGVELVADETCLGDAFFDFPSKTQKMHVTWIALVPAPVSYAKDQTYTLTISLQQQNDIPRYPNLSL